RCGAARQPEDQWTREAADPRRPCPADPSALTGISGHLYFAEKRTLLPCVDMAGHCAAPCPIPESLRSPIYEVDKAAVKTNSRLDKFSAWGRRGGPRETLVAGVRAHPGRGHAETAPQAGLSANRRGPSGRVVGEETGERREGARPQRGGRVRRKAEMTPGSCGGRRPPPQRGRGEPAGAQRRHSLRHAVRATAARPTSPGDGAGSG